MENNANLIHTFRNVMVILSAVLMLVLVILQCLEIKEYGLWQHIQDTLTFKEQAQAELPLPAPAAGEQSAQK